MNFKITLITLAIMLGAAHATWSCSCQYSSNEDEERLPHFDFAFSAYNITNDTIGEDVYARLAVTQLWKGSLPDTLKLWTGHTYDGSAQCLWNLAPKETYIIYAWLFQQPSSNDTIFSSGCDTFLYTQEQASRLDALVSPLNIPQSRPEVWYDPETAAIRFRNALSVKHIEIYNTEGKLVHEASLQQYLTVPLAPGQMLFVILHTTQGTFRERLYIARR